MSQSNSYTNRFSRALEREKTESAANAEADSVESPPLEAVLRERKIGSLPDAPNADNDSPATNGNGHQANGNGHATNGNGHSGNGQSANGSGRAAAEAAISGRLTKPPGFAQLLETWTVGKPPAPNEKSKDETTALVSTAKSGEIARAKTNGKPQITHSNRKTPVCATVEVDSARVEPHIVAITHPRSPHCEEYRNLRTSLLHTAERRRIGGQKLQAVVVASARPGEGKTTTALNLAWLLAQTDGVSALIIDSDLRMPSLADYLGVDEHPGLSDVFDGKAELEQALVRLEPAGLYLLPGGSPRDDVAEMLSGNAFKRVLDQARTMFDYIIIDAPPLGIFTDAAVLINHADGAMLVVKAGKTRYGSINRLLEAIPRDRMLGVVLNGSKEEMSESHYSYYYNYGNKKKING